MLEEFIKTFELPENSELKTRELEEAIMRKYGSIQYFYQKAFSYTSDYDYQERKIPEHYTCGTDFEWESNNIHTNYENEEKYDTREKALMGLLIDNKNKFKGLVRRVYESNNG